MFTINDKAKAEQLKEQGHDLTWIVQDGDDFKVEVNGTIYVGASYIDAMEKAEADQ